MKLSEYKKIIKTPLLPRTVTFLIRENKVLLGYKKRGFGKGNYLGIGGKAERNETIEDAAKREVKEETHVTIVNLKLTGTLYFYFPHIQDESWNQEVHVFIAETWIGDPVETEEIKPMWYEKNKIPYDTMWDDAKYWLPEVLQGKSVTGEFLFDESLKVIDYNKKLT